MPPRASRRTPALAAPPPLPRFSPSTPPPASRCSRGAFAAAFLASAIYALVAWRAFEVLLVLNAPRAGVPDAAAVHFAGVPPAPPLLPTALVTAPAPVVVGSAPGAAAGAAAGGAAGWGDAPGAVLEGTLQGELFVLREWSRNDSARAERLCHGAACSSVRFLQVDMMRPSSDSTLDYVVRVEGRVQEIFSAILATDDGCKGALYQGATPWCRGGGGNSVRAPPLVIDVGSNAGFYTLFSASLGARVLAVDPQPLCAQFVRTGAAASGYGASVRVLNAFAATRASDSFSTVRVRSGCWGTYPVIDGAEVGRSAQYYDALPGGSAEVPVPGLALASIIRSAVADAGGDAEEGVLLLKLDAEGAEAELVEHLEAEGILREHIVKNFVIEVNKMAVLRRPMSACAEDVGACFAALFARFQHAGYLVTVHEPFASIPIEDVEVFAREGWRWADVWFVLPTNDKVVSAS